MAETAHRPDRAEISKLVEQAEKLLQKGKTADALEQYLRILRADTGNDGVRQMAADLCLSLQRVQEAVQLLGDMFERQIQAGDATRASLTYKKLSRYAKPTWQQRVRFGQLLEGSNRKLAMETYENALEELVKADDKQSSLTVLKRIVTLEGNEKNFSRLGDLASRAGDSPTAAAAFLRLGQILEAGGQNGAPYFERAYQENSADVETALAYGKSLLTQGQAGAAIFVLDPHLAANPQSRELREVYGKALIAADRVTEAEPFVWELFEHNPSRLPDVASLIGSFIDAQQDAEAVALARKLEKVQSRRGERKTFAALMQDIAAAHRPSPEFLEFMGELFNSSNRESDYSQTLIKLFDLHVGVGNFAKAAECLDRAAEVDAYEPGHQRRLEQLRGKIDENRFRAIASRFTNVSKQAAEPVRSGAGSAGGSEPVMGASALQDLMLQAEILVQYGMRAKAVERLQRIQELFPNEEVRNEDLQKLYLAAGIQPKFAEPPPPPPAPRAAAPAAPPPPAFVAQPVQQAPDVNALTRVTEISRTLYRQSNSESVLHTAVSEIGGHWNVGRCIAALRKPGQPPTTVTEYQAGGLQPGAPSSLARLVTAAQDMAIKQGAFSLEDAQTALEMQGVRETLAELVISSLLVLPLTDGKDQVGVLLLTHNTARPWNAGDVMVLKSLTDQIVIALNNAGLRRLVKNLSVTEEKSGLLKRSSYIDLLMAETRRAVQQKTLMTVLLMQFGKRLAMLKEFGEASLEAVMEEIGQLFTSNLRQNDLAFRYETTTIALVLGETNETEAMVAVDKLRKLLAEVRLPGREEPIPFNAGVATAVVRQDFDAVDIVTEVINRAEHALDSALSEGPGKITSEAASLAAAAVA